jgi:hypothetical protein
MNSFDRLISKYSSQLIKESNDSSPSTNHSFAVIGEDGWESPDNPPDDDRLVQVAWDDMSTSEKALGFYDGIAEIPDSGRRYWWSHPQMTKLNKGAVGAWREIPSHS